MSDASLQTWVYRELQPAIPPLPVETAEVPPAPAQLVEPGYTEAEVAKRVASALAEAEQRWTAASREMETLQRAQVAVALQAFAAERARYQRDLETEVVQLALAIARKILGREAQVDGHLLQGLVRGALDRIGTGTVVRLRLPPEDLASWQGEAAFAGSTHLCEFVPDASLTKGDCFVETDLGAANFAIDAQLQEIERGVLDVLKSRPQHRARGSILPGAAATKEEAVIKGEPA